MSASSALVHASGAATATMALAASTKAARRSSHGARRNTELRAARLEPTGDAPMVDSDPTSCFRIKEVLGVSMCLKLSKTEKRIGYEYGDEDYCYQVRGKYGGSKDEDPDDMVSDTRWVQLKELVHNMGESELSELDRWAGKLQKAAKAARLALRQRQESDE